MKYYQCPFCQLNINLNRLKSDNLCVMCKSPLKNHEISNYIKPNY